MNWALLKNSDMSCIEMGGVWKRIMSKQVVRSGWRLTVVKKRDVWSTSRKKKLKWKLIRNANIHQGIHGTLLCNFFFRIKYLKIWCESIFPRKTIMWNSAVIFFSTPFHAVSFIFKTRKHKFSMSCRQLEHKPTLHAFLLAVINFQCLRLRECNF